MEALQSVLDDEYGRLGGVGRVLWEERWRRGVVVRYDVRGGAARTDVWRCAEDVERDFEGMLGVEAFVGDRREVGGVSAR